MVVERERDLALSAQVWSVVEIDEALVRMEVGTMATSFVDATDSSSSFEAIPWARAVEEKVGGIGRR